MIGLSSASALAVASLGALLILTAIKLIWPIIFPVVIGYPWPTNAGSPLEQQRDKRRTVAFCGSFNPPHNGHFAMMLYLAERFGRVLIVIGENPNKNYQVKGAQRKQLIEKMLAGKISHENVHVQVVQGLIWRTVKRQGASLFIRGIRNWEKDGKEERSLQILNTWGPLLLGPLWWPLPTVFMEGKPEYNHVSSTLIRRICRGGEEGLFQLVPKTVVQEVKTLYSD